MSRWGILVSVVVTGGFDCGVEYGGFRNFGDSVVKYGEFCGFGIYVDVACAI